VSIVNNTIAEARDVLHNASHGVLSTHSLAVPGYPFGSITPYCLDQRGMPIILIANIALHTKNICADNKVSLTITEQGNGNGNVQEFGRLTLLGNCVQVSDTEEVSIAARYRAYFPDSASYFKVHTFHHFRINIIKVRYIGGFGQIHWLKTEEFLVGNALDEKSQTSIIDHMNKDHQQELIDYCSHFKKLKVINPVMVGIDGKGFDVLDGNNKVRFAFPNPVATLLEAKEIMVAMANVSSSRTKKIS